MAYIDFAGVPGPLYLVGYALAVGTFALAAAGWRHHLRRPADDGQDHPLHPYEAAFLADGFDRLLAASVASLLEGGWLKVAAGGSNVRVSDSAAAGAPRHPLDRAVLSHLGPMLAGEGGNVTGATAWRAAVSGGTPVLAIVDGLQRRGLVLDDAAAAAMRNWPTLLMAAAVVLALPRIVLGLTTNHPVGILFVMMIGAGWLAVRFARAGSVRSRRGDAALRRWRQDPTDGTTTLRDATRSAVSVARFGPSAVAGVVAIFPVTRASDGISGGFELGFFGGGDGGGGDGGGCGGGGCGGCGGGGD